MERTAADDDVALADLPSASGAHWANRDNGTKFREPGGRSTRFRRPPALNSFPDDDREQLSPSAYLPDDGAEASSTGWFAGQDAEPAGTWPEDPSPQKTSPIAPEPAAPAYGPAPPSSPGRASFGFSAGPISPAHDQASTAPTSPATGHQDRSAYPDRPVSQERPAAQDRPVSQERAGVQDRPVSQERAGVQDRPVSQEHPGTQDRAGRQTLGREARRASRREVPPEDSGIGQITGPGRDIRPHRASRRDSAGREARGHDKTRNNGAHDQQLDTGAHGSTPPSGTPQVQAARPRRRRPLMMAAIVLAVVVLLGGAIAGVAYFSGGDRSLTSVLKLGAAGTDLKGRTATAPLGGRKTASFDLVAAAVKVNVRTADLGGDLFKITTGDDSGLLPSPVITDDKVQLRLNADGDGATGEVEVVLSAKVRWSLRFSGGADEQVVDLTGGQVAALDVIGGVRRFDLALPKASGTVPVHLTGAIEDFSIRSPAGNPVRVQVESGAKTVAAGDVTLRDVKPGSTLTPKDWKVANRYDVDAASRLTLLSVDSAA